MEEVWKDISLASLHDPPSKHELNRNTHFHTLTFQDFLSQPFTQNPPPTPTAGGGYPSPASPAPIGLSLNSVPERFNPLSSSGQLRQNSLVQAHHPAIVTNVPCLNNVTSFDALESASCLPELGRKRFPECEKDSSDRRYKRMIKNRESAARSRARKQECPVLAYTNELELEVAHLMEENARLKRQQQQLCLDAATQVPKKHSFHRASTAPF